MEEFNTTGEVARYLGLATRSVTGLADSGKLRSHCLPGSNHRRIQAKAVLEFLIKQNKGMPLNVDSPRAYSNQDAADFLESLVKRDLIGLGFNETEVEQVLGAGLGNFLTTGDVSTYLRICPHTTGVQFDHGNLRGYVIPTTHADTKTERSERRVLVSSIFGFLNENGYRTSTLPANGFLTAGEVAEILSFAPRTVTKRFDRGELRGYRIPSIGNSSQGDDRRISKTSFVEYALRSPGMYESISPRDLEKYNLPLLGKSQTTDATAAAWFF